MQSVSLARRDGSVDLHSTDPFSNSQAYAIELIPLSIVRFREFRHHNNISHGWEAVVKTLFAAAGFGNMILFFSTGRRFGFADRRRMRPGVSAADVGPPHPA